ncbi:universal stress protein [Halovivax sp.]|uniref:universal stress protein n=1 Tax=Halovivax sp. TaxID=1935978 RepID=UPI0025BA6B49|nr:universal stress protein [Halovivax sp.]
MISKILLTTDGSEAAETAAPYAVEFARAFGAELQVMYVVDTDAMSYSLGPEQVDRIRTGQFQEMTELHERAAGAIDRIREYAAEADLEIEPVIEAGNPVDVITRFAAAAGVDVIVMTSAGRGGVRRALLGSVTERVARTTSIPVLVVDPDSGDPETAATEREAA